MAYMLLMAPAVVDYSIRQAKTKRQSLTALSTSCWKDGFAFLKPSKRHPFVFEQAEGGGDGRFSAHPLG